MFAFRLVTHFKNKRINEKVLKKHESKLSEITLDNNGQMRRVDLMSPINTSNESDLPQPACGTTSDSPLITQTPEASEPESARVVAEAADTIRYGNEVFKKIKIRGDGNCFFRAITHLHPSYTQDDHLRLRKMAYDWCALRQGPMQLTDKELRDLKTPNTSVDVYKKNVCLSPKKFE